MGVMKFMPVGITLNSLVCLSPNVLQHRHSDDTRPSNSVPAYMR